MAQKVQFAPLVALAGLEPAKANGQQIYSLPPLPLGTQRRVWSTTLLLSRRWDSNPQHPLYKRGALPIELLRRVPIL